MNHHTGWLSPFVDGLRMKKIARHIIPGDKVLDIGCGTGLLTHYLRKEISYVGIESDPQEIGRNDLKCGSIIQGDGTKTLPFKDNHFDAVVMASFLEHIHDPHLIFKGLERVLNSCGVIIATTPTPLGGKVHEVMAHLGMLSLDAAHDHTHGFLVKKNFSEMIQGTNLEIKAYEKFQFGFNQICVWGKRRGG